MSSFASLVLEFTSCGYGLLLLFSSPVCTLCHCGFHPPPTFPITLSQNRDLFSHPLCASKDGEASDLSVCEVDAWGRRAICVISPTRRDLFLLFCRFESQSLAVLENSVSPAASRRANAESESQLEEEQLRLFCNHSIKVWRFVSSHYV